MGIDVGTAITIVIMILSVIGSGLWFDKRNRQDMSELKEDMSELKKEVKTVSERLSKVEITLVEVQTDLKAQKERFDRMDDRFNRQDDQFNDRFDRQEERHRDLEIQVGRVQGSLDVLIGYRRTTTVAGRERTEQGERVGEPIGD